MRKEEYQVKCPKHIVFGDPLYFEQFKGARLKKLVVDYKPPMHFNAARLILTERPNVQYPEYTDRAMTLYLAPRQYMETYANGMRHILQRIAEKEIGVDTARYLFSIDGRDEEIRTGTDGWWGSFDELYRQIGEKRVSDAVRLTVAMPDHYSFDDMKRLAGYFFEDLQPMPSKQERNENSSR